MLNLEPDGRRKSFMEAGVTGQLPMTLPSGSDTRPSVTQQLTQESLRVGELRAQAVALARAGLKVVPLYGLIGNQCACRKKAACPTPGKHPISKNWQERTLDTPDDTRRFRWREDHNLGILCGKTGGVVALDVDRHRPEEDGFESLAKLEQQFGPLPARPRQRSGGGGMHLLFRYPEHVELAPPKTLAPGIEVIADNHQLVVASSRHQGGTFYQWDGDAAPWEIELPELPHWLLLRLAKLPEPRRQPWRTGPFDMAAFIARHNLDVKGPHPWHATGGLVWEFRRCPFADRHTTGPGGAYIGVHGSGAPVAGCLHSHCVGQWNFKTLRGILESLHSA